MDTFEILRCYAWGGASRYHDYQLTTGEVVTLHDTETYIVEGKRYAAAEGVAGSRATNGIQMRPLDI